MPLEDYYELFDNELLRNAFREMVALDRARKVIEDKKKKNQ